MTIDHRVDWTVFDDSSIFCAEKAIATEVSMELGDSPPGLGGDLLLLPRGLDGRRITVPLLLERGLPPPIMELED
jgi:hypothetical protein